ncbi:hypothetical protein VTN02DRAFT_96 [Thermoascus thermophilus]
MTDLTPIVNQLLTETHASPPIPGPGSRAETVDEFLKEAYRINSHITSLLRYLHSIRHSYLSTAATAPRLQSQSRPPHRQRQTPLTDTERDAIDASTALLLRDLSAGGGGGGSMAGAAA